MPLLVSVLPVPSPAEATPRGIKRTRTPDRSGNGHTEGDQDDGMCAMGRHVAWHLASFSFEIITLHAFFIGRILHCIV